MLEEPSDLYPIPLLDQLDSTLHLDRELSIQADNYHISVIKAGYTKQDIIDILSAIIEGLPEDD